MTREKKTLKIMTDEKKITVNSTIYKKLFIHSIKTLKINKLQLLIPAH